MEELFTPNVILGQKPGDFIVGANIDTPEIVNESGNWDKYQIEHERQNLIGETSSCAVFGSNNSKEVLATKSLDGDNLKWFQDNGYVKNGFINFDDRVPAMFSEITLGVGTYMYKAAEACRKWTLPEGILPPAKTIDEYYNKSKLTQKAIDLQAEFDKRFKWVWFWVNDLDEGLKYSPVVGTVAFMNGSNILCPTTPHNHCVTAKMADKDTVTIMDSYIQEFKTYCRPAFSDYLCWKLITINNNMIDKSKFLKENDKRQVRNKDNGAYGVIYGGQLLAINAERAGFYMIDREARDLIGKLPTIQLSDNEWSQIWSNRYF